ncbi:MAG: L-2-hydroxyglutarate oxidase [Planctomycetes bacterium]|nr:L-2-hydroxyglutarate oxidase [Planctomycetota bacterium]
MRARGAAGSRYRIRACDARPDRTPRSGCPSPARVRPPSERTRPSPTSPARARIWLGSPSTHPPPRLGRSDSRRRRRTFRPRSRRLDGSVPGHRRSPSCRLGWPPECAAASPSRSHEPTPDARPVRSVAALWLGSSPPPREATPHRRARSEAHPPRVRSPTLRTARRRRSRTPHRRTTPTCTSVRASVPRHVPRTTGPTLGSSFGPTHPTESVGRDPRPRSGPPVHPTRPPRSRHRRSPATAHDELATFGEVYQKSVRETDGRSASRLDRNRLPSVKSSSEPHRTCEVTIVGGGIVGLATTYQLLSQRPGTEVVLVEKEPRVAAHQTGHNSGVIHSGLYYKPGSRKAETCVRGSKEMFAFCRAHDIPHERCGKVVVATDPAEIERLDELERRGRANGVQLTRIGPDGLRDVEPHATGLEALHVPDAAIVDYRVVAERLRDLVVEGGGEIRFGARVRSMREAPHGVILETEDGTTIQSATAVTCCGLQSDRVARQTTPDLRTKIVPFRGEYYEVVPERAELVHGMIYPVPDPRFPFLGVHFTRRIGGGVEAGPNAVLALRREGYGRFSFSPRDALDSLGYSGFWRLARRYLKTGLAEIYRSFHKPAFTRALQKLVPEVRSEDLRRGGAGVRAQALDRNGSLIDDFALVETDRIVHVVNAPSPAATASLAIGEEIAGLMRKRMSRHVGSAARDGKRQESA